MGAPLSGVPPNAGWMTHPVARVVERWPLRGIRPWSRPRRCRRQHGRGLSAAYALTDVQEVEARPDPAQHPDHGAGRELGWWLRGDTQVVGRGG